MKKLAVFVALTVIFLTGATAKSKSKPSKEEKTTTDATETVLFSGDGGKGLVIEINELQMSNIGDEFAWLPEFAVNMIGDDIAKYSAIQVIDKHNLGKIASAQARIERDSSADIEIGNIVIPKCLLLVSLIGKGGAGYSISAKINEIETAKTVAAFNNPDCQQKDIESGKVLKEAVADLLEQIGVQLTESGKKKLLAVKDGGSKNNVAAQILVAKGQQAEQGGSKVEALTYYLQASGSDSTLKRAEDAVSSIAVTMASGDFGAKARNLIQYREDLIALTKEVQNFLGTADAYVILIDNNFKLGEIDYINETYTMTVSCGLVWSKTALSLLATLDKLFDDFFDQNRYDRNAREEQFADIMGRCNYYHAKNVFTPYARIKFFKLNFAEEYKGPFARVECSPRV
ncbi:MAG: hypothetical protein MJ193_01495, partial [Clostridia bacterium]|nr:hypothetical protein [Clostridia bacterium]